ncbi:hypothetical protein PHMEG_00015330 [Phytophthora megakarya]|uniref:MULE transposase domain-containing protein n=1 Tax=Phytophthora megakarya TaxID=4795 RepID=A0A225W343_9STRA|nr:hypothetical protein PHMEG_00015330 [Phytophthora megakarya]
MPAEDAEMLIQDFKRNKITKIGDRMFSGEEDETAAFSLCFHQDADGKPIVGNGSDTNPFVVGVSTKKLLRQADRDPATFILHLDATYKLTQAGYPVIVVGLSDRARHFHPLAIFIVSQQKQPQYTEVLQLLQRAFVAVTNKPLRVQYVMGDADIAQWNALHDVFGADVCFLMCYFHVAKKVFEKTRSLTPHVAASVMKDLHTLHFTFSQDENFVKLDGIQMCWALVPQLSEFSSYFAKVWLNRRVSRWQCYHTPSGFATTNNPCETYNAALKRDVTLRRKLKIGAMLDQLFTLCESESARPRPFADAPTPDARVIRRAVALQRERLLLERRVDRSSIAFLLGGSPPDADSIVRVVSLPAPRIYDEVLGRTVETLPVSAQLSRLTASMEREGMPHEGWPVDVERQMCPCRMCSKFGTYVHVLCALSVRGSCDLNGRATLVYRGTCKRRRQVSAQPAGRPSNSGVALSFQ